MEASDELCSRAQPAIEVRQDVVNQLNANGETYRIGAYPRRGLLLGRELRVRR